jgi:predicted PurR-regulated permease PerM
LALGVLVLYTVLYQVSGNVLGPLVMGKAVRLHPFVILLATMVGTVLGGVSAVLPERTGDHVPRTRGGD